jgi:Uma2 family endonuclease
MSMDIPAVPPVDTTTAAPAPMVPGPGGLALMIDGQWRVPAGIVDAESFRRWSLSAEFPGALQASWHDGKLWIETPAGPSLGRLNSGRDIAPVPSTGAAVVLDGEVWVPTWVVDLASFRRWVLSQEYPRCVRLSYLNGLLWIDRTMEQMYTHNQIKEVVNRVLGTLVFSLQQGRWLPDGMRVSNHLANLSTEPDGLYVSYTSLQSGRVRRIAGRVPGVIELEGSPEMVLEVVSDSSVQKDLVELPMEYHQARIDEFWRIDARGANPLFEIFRWTAAGYVPTQLPDGWWQSTIFAHAFRLTVQPDPLGDPLFVLEMR